MQRKPSPGPGPDSNDSLPRHGSSGSSGSIARVKAFFPPNPAYSNSWLHVGELVFLAVIFLEFLAVHVTESIWSISATCQAEDSCRRKLRDGLTFDSKVQTSFLCSFPLNLPLLSKPFLA